jgi:hypothetical protein
MYQADSILLPTVVVKNDAFVQEMKVGYILSA